MRAGILARMAIRPPYGGRAGSGRGAVVHGPHLTGDGITGAPLDIAAVDVARLDDLHDHYRERTEWDVTLAQYSGFANGPIGAAIQISRSANGEPNLIYGAFSPNPPIWQVGADRWRIVSVSQLQAGASRGTVEIAFGAPFATRTIQASGATAFASQNLFIEVGGAYRIPGAAQVVTYTVTVPEGAGTRELTVTAAELRALTASMRGQSSTPSGHAHVLGTADGVEYRIGRTAAGGLLLSVNAVGPVSRTIAIASDDGPPTTEAAALPDGWDWQIGDLVLRSRDAEKQYYPHSVAGGETTESLRVLIWSTIAPGTLAAGATTLRALGTQIAPAASHKGAFTPSLAQVAATDAQQLQLAAVGDLPAGLTLAANAITIGAAAAGTILGIDGTFEVEAYTPAPISGAGARSYPKIYWTRRKAGSASDDVIKHATAETYLRQTANAGTPSQQQNIHGPDAIDIHVGFSEIFGEGDVIKVWGIHPWVSDSADNAVNQLKVLAANSEIVIIYSGEVGGKVSPSLPDAPVADGGLLASEDGKWRAGGFENTGNVDFSYNTARHRFAGHVTFPKQTAHLDTVLDETVAGAAHGNDTSAVLDADFTAGKESFRFWRVYYSADDGDLTVNIGTAANPVPNPAGVLLRDFLLSITNTAGTKRTFHLREADFEPDDSAGSTHEWVFRNVPADILTRLTDNEIQLYEPISAVNYLPTPSASDAGDVPTVNTAGTAYELKHPLAAAVATYNKTEADIGHDLKAVVLEESEPKGGTATYEADIQQWSTGSVQIAPGFSGHFELGVPGGSGSMPGRWTLELGGGAGTTAAAVWGQEISAFRFRFSDGTDFSAWVEYAVERDTSITNALAYRTTASDLSTPTQWASPSDGDTERFEFDFQLADGTNAYPAEGTISQKALSPSDLKSWLAIPGRYVQGASVAGKTLTLTLSDGSTVALNASLSPAGTGITEAQVRALIAAIAGAVDFSVAGTVITATLAAASVGAGNLDAGNVPKQTALRNAIGAGTSDVGDTEIDARIQAPARAGNTDPWPDAKLGVRDMTAAAYAALAADQRGGTIYVSG